MHVRCTLHVQGQPGHGRPRYRGPNPARVPEHVEQSGTPRRRYLHLFYFLSYRYLHHHHIHHHHLIRIIVSAPYSPPQSFINTILSSSTSSPPSKSTPFSSPSSSSSSSSSPSSSSPSSSSPPLSSPPSLSPPFFSSSTSLSTLSPDQGE